jgi:hypothetical protein
MDPTSLASLYPDDPEAQLAACWAPTIAGENAAGRDRGYKRAAALLPASAAPHLLYAGALAQRVPLHRREMKVLHPPSQRGGSEPTLTSEEKGLAAEADRALRRVGELDPQNAAVDCLVAYLAFANHQDAEALDALKRALAKSGWDLYERESRQARFRFLQRVYPRAEAADYALEWTSAPITPFVDLARMLAGLSALAA